MNKRFLSMLAACAVASAIGGAFAADQPQGSQPEAVSPAAKPADGNNAGSQRDVLKEKDAYFAAMNKCDALQGVAEKQQCVDAVRKQYGQM